MIKTPRSALPPSSWASYFLELLRSLCVHGSTGKKGEGGKEGHRTGGPGGPRFRGCPRPEALQVGLQGVEPLPRAVLGARSEKRALRNAAASSRAAGVRILGPGGPDKKNLPPTHLALHRGSLKKAN